MAKIDVGIRNHVGSMLPPLLPRKALTLASSPSSAVFAPSSDGDYRNRVGSNGTGRRPDRGVDDEVRD